MVNKKLTSEQEDEIYLMYLSGQTMTKISSLYPVVISTIQRIIERKSANDDSVKNIIFPKISKNLLHAEKPIKMAIKFMKENNEVFHKKQSDLLLKEIQNIREQLNIIENNLKVLPATQ